VWNRVISLFCFVSLFFLSCATLQRKITPYVERDISGPVTITTEWLEITPTEPLKPEREVNVVNLVFTTEYKPDYQSNGLRLKDGALALLEVQLVDQYGKTYMLGIESMGPKGIGYGLFDPISHLESLPKDKVYPTVRIKSNKPIECSKIIWRSYNQRDRK
jgi:hypothetical protein